MIVYLHTGILDNRKLMPAVADERINLCDCRKSKVALDAAETPLLKLKDRGLESGSDVAEEIEAQP